MLFRVSVDFFLLPTLFLAFTKILSSILASFSLSCMFSAIKESILDSNSPILFFNSPKNLYQKTYDFLRFMRGGDFKKISTISF